MSLGLILYLISYPICSFINYGMLNAQIHAEYNRLYSRQEAGNQVLLGCIFGLLSLFGLFLVFCTTGFMEHGLKFNCKKEKR